MSNLRWNLGLLVLLLGFGYFSFRFAASTLAIEQLVNRMEQSAADHTRLKHVILISQERDNPFWKTVETGANEAAAQWGMQIEYMGPIRINSAEQKGLLEQSIAAKPDAILAQGVKDPEYDLLIAKAADRGIPVITVDTDAPGSRRLAYVGTDNTEAGKRMGELVTGETDGGGSIGIIIGSGQAENQWLRVEGFRSVVERAPGFKIEAVRASNISRLQAAEQAEAMLDAYPGIRTMVGFSSWDAVGIEDGLKARHRADIRIFGFDDLEETVQAVSQRDVVASMVQQPKAMGYEAVSLLDKHFRGEPIPERRYTGTEILDSTEDRPEAAGKDKR